MVGIIIGVLGLIGVIIAVVCSTIRTPDHLRGYYGSMFWTIAIIAIVVFVALVVVGILL
jgi:hypothetical protein